jgi:hypothetical protein
MGWKKGGVALLVEEADEDVDENGGRSGDDSGEKSAAVPESGGSRSADPPSIRSCIDVDDDDDDGGG